MEDGEAVPEGARGKDAVHTRSDGQAGTARAPIQVYGVHDNGFSERRLDDGQRQHGVAPDPKGLLARESLQDLLYDRKAGHDLVEVDDLLEHQALRPAEDVDPRRRVNEDHGDAPACRRDDLRGRGTGSLPRRRCRRAPECGAPAHGGRSPPSPARRPANRSARGSPAASPREGPRQAKDLCVSCVYRATEAATTQPAAERRNCDSRYETAGDGRPHRRKPLQMPRYGIGRPGGMPRILLAAVIVVTLSAPVAGEEPWSAAYKPGDFAPAATLLQRAVFEPPSGRRASDPAALKQLALLYRDGKGVERDAVLPCGLIPAHAPAPAGRPATRDAKALVDKYCAPLSAFESAAAFAAMSCPHIGPQRGATVTLEPGCSIRFNDRSATLIRAGETREQALASDLLCHSQVMLVRHSPIDGSSGR